MREGRQTFPITELLLLAASGVAVWVTQLGWVPCAGTMLEGTPFDATPHDWNFTAACQAAMDHGDGFPISGWLASPLQQTVNGLNAVALLLLGLAWLFLVHRCQVRGRVRLVLAALPGLLNLWLAAVAAAAFLWPPAEVPVAAALAILLMDIAGVVGALALFADGATPLGAGSGVRVILLTLAVTAPSLGHILTDSMIMGTFSNANWDSPPGTGYLTAFSIALCSVLSVIVGAVGRRRRRRPARLVPRSALAG